MEVVVVVVVWRGVLLLDTQSARGYHFSFVDMQHYNDVC